MNDKKKIELIKYAIQKKRELHLNFEYGLGGNIESSFHPYIYGEDLMQYHFVWGFIPFNHVFYKFIIDWIDDIIVQSNEFVMQKDTCYTHSAEESFYEFLPELYQPEVRVYRTGCF